MNANDEMKELEISSINMMSHDYKVRFVAEYIQLKVRANKLERMLRDWDNGNLSFTPTNPRSLLNMQLRAMREYEAILEIRAQIEGINLDSK